jgi:GGDEF domain-containing protein
MRIGLPTGLLTGLWLAGTLWAQAQPLADGQTLYLEGRLPDGSALVGQRAGGVRVEGRQAACVTCHRRSGYGSAEGRRLIPAITGEYLFRPKAQTLEQTDLRLHQGYAHDREPYDDASLARVIREGRRPDGATLDYLMPRYDLGAADMRQLIDYLKGLSSQAAPGVEAETLHFATIIAPDAEPQRRQAMLDVLEKFFADRSAFNRGQSRRMQVASENMFRTTRKWRLHVWQLDGPAESWPAQLQRRLAEQPVFAVISGLARDWAPVHAFCQAQKLPCLLPNTDLPVVAEADFYPVYLHAGVRLEAQLAAQALADNKAPVLQVYREGDVGSAAAGQLAAALAGQGIASRQLALPAADAGDALQQALQQLKAEERLLLWLRRDDIQRLPAAPPAAAALLVSSIMAGEDAAVFPPAWRAALQLLYPYDLPGQRKVRMQILQNWLRHKQLAVTDLRLQADTYVAASVLADSIDGLNGVFNRDYLLERLESMLSQRVQNAHYPRLGLAPGQRFASKGGYVVRQDGQGQWSSEADWMAP